MTSLEHRAEMAKYFVPENLKRTWEEELSPSGRYKLVIGSYSTGAGSWNYTQGLIYRVDSDQPLFTVQRNYSAFPFSWIEGHPNGHDYLICGEDYQGQTVLELDTGKRRDFLPKDAEEGMGFCWAQHRFDPTTRTLVVDGCYWACPYEYRLYDFSDPIGTGWPLLESEHWVEVDARWPTFEPDGTIICYQTESDDEDSDDETDPLSRPVTATLKFKREGLKLVLQEEWVSEKERKIRADREEARRRYDEWLENYRTTDPLYTTLKKEVQADSTFSPADHIGVGTTHDKWCPDYKTSERRVCWDLHRKDNITVVADIALTGPVKLELFRDGKHVEDKFFMDHSVDSVLQAVAYAREFIRGVS